MSEEKPKQLTAKQKIFIAEYLKDFNAARAAREAGYSPDTAQQMGSENLSKPFIKDEINRQIDILLADTRQTAMETVRELKKIAFAKITDYVDYDEDSVTVKDSDKIDASAISQIDIEEKTTRGKDGEEGQTTINYKIKLHDKVKALDLLAKYTEIYHENIKVTADGKIDMVMNIIPVTPKTE